MLRSVGAADVPRLAAILREPEVSRWWGGYDEERVRRELVEDEGTAVFAVEVSGEVVGVIQYAEEPDPEYRHAGLDVSLSTSFQGQGLGPEALRVLARHLFDERGHHRLVIDPAASNARAIRAYEKAGFRRVGVMRQYERACDGRGATVC